MHKPIDTISEMKQTIKQQKDVIEILNGVIDDQAVVMDTRIKKYKLLVAFLSAVIACLVILSSIEWQTIKEMAYDMKDQIAQKEAEQKLLLECMQTSYTLVGDSE